MDCMSFLDLVSNCFFKGKNWTRWFLWIPSNLRYSITLWFYGRLSEIITDCWCFFCPLSRPNWLSKEKDLLAQQIHTSHFLKAYNPPGICHSDAFQIFMWAKWGTLWRYVFWGFQRVLVPCFVPWVRGKEHIFMFSSWLLSWSAVTCYTYDEINIFCT